MSATENRPAARRRGLYLLRTSCLLACSAAAAQPSAVTDADIERARQDQPVITDADMERARQRHQGLVRGLDSQPNPAAATPNIDALPQPAISSPIDLEALANGYMAQTDPMEHAQALTGPGLMVFVSLSMPKPTLTRLFEQAARVRASVLVRGFTHGSLQATVLQVQQLIGERNVAVQIDPQAFDRFAVKRVPTFVLVRDGTRPVSCAAGTCAPPEAFLQVGGDVSLRYALEYMQRSAPQFRADAAGFLDRLK